MKVLVSFYTLILYTCKYFHVSFKISISVYKDCMISLDMLLLGVLVYTYSDLMDEFMSLWNCHSNLMLGFMLSLWGNSSGDLITVGLH